jgi:hypothetical protein
MKPILRIFAWGWVGLFWLGTSWAGSETLSLPIILDPTLLRAFLIQQVFPEPGPRAILIDPKNRCNRIELKDPEVETGEQGLILSSRLLVRAGLSVMAECFQPVDWEGSLTARLEPNLEPKDWRLHFQVADSRLYQRAEEEISVARVVWDLVKRYVHPQLEKFSVNLAPPVSQIRNLIPLMVQAENRDRVSSWLKTLRPGAVETGAEAIRIPLLFEVEFPEPVTAIPEGSGPPEKELERLQALWELYDPFVVFQILALSEQPLTPEERDRVLEILLAGRYQVALALDQADTPAPDLIRRQFVAAWSGLNPILRKYLVQEPSSNLVNYLAFFSVMDALRTLDRIGLAFGLEISRNGLIRLARLLGPPQSDWEPRYSEEVDPRLREILLLGPPIEEPGPEYDAEEVALPEGLWPEADLGPESLGRWMIRPAAAGVGDVLRAAKDLGPYIPPRKDADPYISRIRGLISRAVERVINGYHLDRERLEGFKKLVPATAWQESCWRQFTVSGGKLRYLTSSNRTSVGLMQINVRVWRGIYRPGSLRWNIHYNARAGTEILARYLRYSLKRSGPSDPLNDALLGQAVYAMYNGGPEQFDLFLQRVRRKDRRQLSDRLFKEKYEWVEEGRWDKIGLCLTGKET